MDTPSPNSPVSAASLSNEQASPAAQPPTILAVLDDLMFLVKIQDAAKRVGARALFVKQEELLRQRIASEKPFLLLFDLQTRLFDVIGFIEACQATPELAAIPKLGYLSHVETALRDRALQAGCQQVVPRSVIAAKLPELLQAALPA